MKEPDWVCVDCIKDRGARIAPYHVATWHIDTCGICKQEKEVTEPRDCGKTRYLLKIENE